LQYMTWRQEHLRLHPGELHFAQSLGARLMCPWSSMTMGTVGRKGVDGGRQLDKDRR